MYIYIHIIILFIHVKDLNIKSIHIFWASLYLFRFQLINMRMNRYFKRSHKITKIENYLNNCKLGDWFVLYQLSKNLNRPFFMDFLTTLSVRYAHGHVCDEEDPEEDGALLNQMDNYLKPSAKVECKIATVIKKFVTWIMSVEGQIQIYLKRAEKNVYFQIKDIL